MFFIIPCYSAFFTNLNLSQQYFRITKSRAELLDKVDASKWKSKSKCLRIRETNWKFLRSQFALRDRLHSISWKFLQRPGCTARTKTPSPKMILRVSPKHHDPSYPVDKFSTLG